MKIKTLSRSADDYTRDRISGVDVLQRNRDPVVHPFEQAREYTRAVRAVKMDKMFAKPLIGAMDDHSDGVWCTVTSPTKVTQFVSGACDGQIRLWDLVLRRTVWSQYAHTGFVRGLCFSRDGQKLFSCGDDNTIKMFDVSACSRATSKGSSAKLLEEVEDSLETGASSTADPGHIWMTKSGLTSIDHCWSADNFITSGRNVSIWDYSRSEPLHTFTWGSSTVTTVRYNPAQPNIFASTGNDRSIVVYDSRTSTPVRKIILYLRSNAMCWNPQEPMNFALANEDHNAYTFDMRRLKSAKIIHKDHVQAVMDVSFSPTGRHLVTGSYDRTIRIFDASAGRSHQVYHTKRMQRVFTVDYTRDSKYILSGSDDANVRIWKSNASQRLGRAAPRAHRRENYMEKLKKRYAHTKEVKRISRHQHTPKLIHKMAAAKREESVRMRVKRKRKEEHSRAGSIKRTKERASAIVKEFE